MASMKKIAEGLNILLKYAPTGEVQPAHDVIYASGPQKVSPLDAAYLRKIGWRWDDANGCWAVFT